MVDFIMLAALIGMAFLVWDCVEVGRNDATNLVNAVLSFCITPTICITPGVGDNACILGRNGDNSSRDTFHLKSDYGPWSLLPVRDFLFAA